MTGGVAYEALNNIGISGANVIVVLNDNGRSYAPTVSRISSAGRFVPPDGSPARDFFESLGLSYFGPVDGHDLVSLEEMLRLVAGCPGPVVLHVHTQKGRGLCAGRARRGKVPARRRALRSRDGPGPRWAVGASQLHRGLRRRPCPRGGGHTEIVAITAAMPGPTGLLGFRDRYPERFFDVGIAEQHAVNAAAGMAMGGLRPVVAIYSTFLNRAWDQVYYDVGSTGSRWCSAWTAAGITGDDGPSHHGVLDMMLLSKVPGMTVSAPSCYEEVGNMLHEALSITRVRWLSAGRRAKRAQQRSEPARGHAS